MFRCTKWTLKCHLRTGAPSLRGWPSVWTQSGQPAGQFNCMSGCYVFSLWGEKNTLSWVVTVCSAPLTRTPETTLDMEKEAATSALIITGAPIALHGAQWGHRHPLPCWGNGRIRGKLGHAAWVGECIVKELPRWYLTESRGELRQDEIQPEPFQHQDSD